MPSSSVEGAASSGAQHLALIATVAELFDDAVLLAGPDGAVQVWNAGAARLFGHSVEDVVGQPLARLWPEEETAAAAELLRTIRSGGTVRSHWVRRRTRDGRTIDVLLSVVSLGAEIGTLAVLRDVTPNVRAREELARAEERLRLTADNLSDIVWQYDVAADRFRYASRATMSVLGYSPEDWMSLAWRDVVVEEDMRSLVEAVAGGLRVGAVSGRSSFRLTLNHRHRDGRSIPCEVQATILRGADGRPSMAFGTTRDIRERLQAEAAREKLQAELAQAQRMEAMGLLAGGVAHDFNNQLAVICSAGEEIVRALDAGHPLYEDATEIVSAGRRSAELTRQLLAFSRRQVVSRENVDVGVLLNGLDRMLRRLIGENIVLEVDVARGVGHVLADPGQLEQVVVNLCLNARDAMTDGGLLRLEAWRAGESEVGIAVSDTGVGMNEDIRARIFEPFFTTKGRGKGTGLGLSVVHGIVAQFGGTVAVTSTPGEGARFEVRLPRSAGEAPSGEMRVYERTPVSTRGSETILAVEDDGPVLRVVTRTLSRHGYHVLSATEGGRGALLAERHPGGIDLLLSDVVMPHMYGPELAERFRAARPKAAVVYMTGYADEALESYGDELASATVLRKPFDAADLLRTVRRALDRRG